MKFFTFFTTLVRGRRSGSMASKLTGSSGSGGGGGGTRKTRIQKEYERMYQEYEHIMSIVGAKILELLEDPSVREIHVSIGVKTEDAFYWPYTYKFTVREELEEAESEETTIRGWESYEYHEDYGYYWRRYGFYEAREGREFLLNPERERRAEFKSPEAYDIYGR